ncbi:MAG: Aspartyl-tRNA(Asn) amidotransferase subunit A @ Glutamyl-tRNA(Gln) amidotransferase subunit A, partial [uncultured Thermoleophilia bacterium]
DGPGRRPAPRLDHAHARPGRAAGPAARDQGPVRHGGRAHDLRLGAVRRPRPGPRRVGRDPAARRRLGRRRQDEPARVRVRRDVGEPVVRRGRQPPRPDAGGRRLVGRVGGGAPDGRLRPGARHRHGGLHPDPRLGLRRRRVQAGVRGGAPRRVLPARAVARPRRPDGPHRRGLRRGLRHPRRPRAGRGSRRGGAARRRDPPRGRPGRHRRGGRRGRRPDARGRARRHGRRARRHGRRPAAPARRRRAAADGGGGRGPRRDLPGSPGALRRGRGAAARSGPRHRRDARPPRRRGRPRGLADDRRRAARPVPPAGAADAADHAAPDRRSRPPEPQPPAVTDPAVQLPRPPGRDGAVRHRHGRDARRAPDRRSRRRRRARRGAHARACHPAGGRPRGL